ncbi:hypothetical protein ACTGYO_11000, partial [Streptococcus suis]
MLDRVGLLATRLGDVDQADRDVGMAALRDLRVGVNVTQLAPERIGDTAEIAALRRDVAAHYRTCDTDTAAAPASTLLARIDAAIA